MIDSALDSHSRAETRASMFAYCFIKIGGQQKKLKKQEIRYSDRPDKVLPLGSEVWLSSAHYAEEKAFPTLTLHAAEAYVCLAVPT